MEKTIPKVRGKGMGKRGESALAENYINILLLKRYFGFIQRIFY